MSRRWNIRMTTSIGRSGSDVGVDLLILDMIESILGLHEGRRPVCRCKVIMDVCSLRKTNRHRKFEVDSQSLRLIQMPLVYAKQIQNTCSSTTTNIYHPKGQRPFASSTYMGLDALFLVP